MERLKSLFDRNNAPGARGEQAESIALDYLKARGMRFVEKNYRCRNGEIDLIMQHSDVLVFVEVRYRKNPNFGSALESIDARKRSRLIHCASHYLATHKNSAAARFDVVAIAPMQRSLDIQWIPDAFQS